MRKISFKILIPVSIAIFLSFSFITISISQQVDTSLNKTINESFEYVINEIITQIKQSNNSV
ncbi:MAG: hypothetical protein PQJ46_00180, partial [Spirochaetales bacterium]|nr:hypothetical protein [Spirochaetales bacterium]